MPQEGGSKPEGDNLELTLYIAEMSNKQKKHGVDLKFDGQSQGIKFELGITCWMA